MNYKDLLPQFDAAYAETLRYCQVVEHDVMMILALLQEGDPKANLIEIREQRKTLGEIIHDIHEIDESQDKPFFSVNDYKVLYSIRNERNHFVHEAFSSFLYKTGELAEEAFRKEQERLQKFHANMALMAKATQRARIAAAKRKYPNNGAK